MKEMEWNKAQLYEFSKRNNMYACAIDCDQGKTIRRLAFLLFSRTFGNKISENWVLFSFLNSKLNKYDHDSGKMKEKQENQAKYRVAAVWLKSMIFYSVLIFSAGGIIMTQMKSDNMLYLLRWFTRCWKKETNKKN